MCEAMAGKNPRSRPVPWCARALPRIRTAGRFSHFDRGFEDVYCAATHALHLYEYPCRLMRDGQEVRIEPGDVTLSPAGGRTMYDMAQPGRHLCVHFWPGEEREEPDPGSVAWIPLHIHLGPRRDQAVQKLLSVIRWHTSTPNDPVARAAASAAFLEFLLWLVRARPTAPRGGARRSDGAAEAAADLIDRRLHRCLSVPDIARQVGLSQNYLARCFRARYGLTIPAYLLARRIELAGYLLASTDLGIKEVGARVGMPDAQHFNKQFRRLLGQSPSAARAAARAPRPRGTRG